MIIPNIWGEKYVPNHQPDRDLMRYSWMSGFWGYHGKVIGNIIDSDSG
jgi:hypothetical protein